jgi:hypothetical protein
MIMIYYDSWFARRPENGLAKIVQDDLAELIFLRKLCTIQREQVVVFMERPSEAETGRIKR